MRKNPRLVVVGGWWWWGVVYVAEDEPLAGKRNRPTVMHNVPHHRPLPRRFFAQADLSSDDKSDEEAHETMLKILKARLVKVRATKALFTRNPDLVVSHLIKVADDTLSVDVVPVLMQHLEDQIDEGKLLHSNTYHNFSIFSLPKRKSRSSVARWNHSPVSDLLWPSSPSSVSEFKPLTMAVASMQILPFAIGGTASTTWFPHSLADSLALAHAATSTASPENLSIAACFELLQVLRSLIDAAFEDYQIVAIDAVDSISTHWDSHLRALAREMDGPAAVLGQHSISAQGMYVQLVGMQSRIEELCTADGPVGKAATRVTGKLKYL